MAESLDSLFKLAETAAPDPGRIMPSQRVYAASTETLDLTNAIARMQSRRTDPSQRIKGGLDDVSDGVRILTTKDNTSENSGKAAKSNKKVTAGELKAALDGLSGLSVKTTSEEGNASRAKRVSATEIMGGITLLHTVLKGLVEAVTALGNKKEDTPPSHQNDDPLSDFRKGDHRVTYLVNGMEFTVRCLNRIRDTDSHCLVLVFSEDCESFFTPPAQSELAIRYDGIAEPGKLFYFGMTFTIHELGLRFIGFLLDDNPSDMSSQTSETTV